MLESLSIFLSELLGFNPMDMISVLCFVIVVVFILAVLIRVIHKKASGYNHALASAMAILFIYLGLLVLREGFGALVNPTLEIMPLIDYNGDTITLYKFSIDAFVEGCTEYLYVFILSFILIGLDDIIPDSKNGVAWIFVQLFVAILAMVVYSFVIECINEFIPDVIDSYAPLILVCILLFMVLLGVMKVILSLLLAAVNPLLGAVSTFFSSSRLGQALGKAVLCSIILCAVSIYMRSVGLDSFDLSELNLLVCGLPMLVLLGLWVVVGYVL